jgi:hypothetical protein
MHAQITKAINISGKSGRFFNLNEICKITGIIGYSIYREWEAVLNT